MGTRWLISQGIADPKRICIVGWSYGGYAALLGAVREPDLYRCAASIAGVSDLKALERQESFYNVPVELVLIKDGTHDLERQDMRLTLFQKLEAVLAANLGPG